MCGIAGLFIREPTLIKSHRGLELFVDSLALSLEERGKDATGIAAVGFDGTVQIEKAAKPATDFIIEREPIMANPKMVIVHTRAKTKGDPSNNLNNHPIIYNSCYVVHNGSIKNDDDLFEKYGFKRNGEVDSEIIAALMYEANFDVKKMIEAYQEMDGPCATITIDPERHPGKMVIAKTHTSPLYLLDAGKFVAFASTWEALRDAWGYTLGTPPAKKKFVDVNYRKLGIVSDEGIEHHDIPFVQQAHNPANGRWVNGTWVPHSDTHKANPTQGVTTPTRGTVHGAGKTSGTASTKGLVVTIDEIRERSRDNRIAHGVIAIAWNAGTAPKSGTYLSCEVCHRRCHDDYIHETTRERMCSDCRKAWFDLLDEKYHPTTKADVTPTVLRTERNILTTEQKNALNIWAQDDAWVHETVIKGLTKEFDLDQDALEFIMFRMSDNMLNEAPAAKAIRTAAYARYFVEMHGTWEWMDEDNHLEWKEILRERGQETKKALPSPPITAPAGLLYDTPAPKENGKCTFCRSKTKRRTALGAICVNYCSKHFDGCATVGCKEVACVTRHDGIRVCHKCSRGQKGVYGDKVLQQAGYIVGGTPV